MTDQTKERWYQLCVLAAVENNPAKLFALVTEINRLLKERERLLPADQRDKMRRMWRNIARELDQELDFTKVLTMTGQLSQDRLERESQNTRRGRASAA